MRRSTRISIVSLALLGWGACGAFGPIAPAALAQQSNPGEKKSWTDSISSGFKQTIGKLAPSGDKKPPPANYKDDPIALSTKSNPGPELYVAVARLYAQSGKLSDAAKQYQTALKMKPDYTPAILGYAELLEQLGHTDEALQFYQRAIKINPAEAAPAYNNLGLCLARQKRLDEALAALTEAVKRAPKNPLYRNNIATLLVNQGRYREAYANLRAVHEEAAAYYNMGYLLYGKGQTLAALQHFAQALKADPTMAPAQQWINFLQKKTAVARRPERPRVEYSPPTFAEKPESPRYTAPAQREPPRASREAPPMPPEEPTPRRLPPTETRGSDLEKAPLPGIYYHRSTAPEAPMPPPSSNPAIQPLPRVN